MHWSHLRAGVVYVEMKGFQWWYSRWTESGAAFFLFFLSDYVLGAHGHTWHKLLAIFMIGGIGYEWMVACLLGFPTNLCTGLV